MSENLDDNFDFEEDVEITAKDSVKHLWENNPLMKVAAIVVGLAVLYFAFTFFLGEEDVVKNDISQVKEAPAVAGSPGQETDPEYAKALEKQNEQRAAIAETYGSSSMPTPIGGAEDELRISDEVQKDEDDPLKEWRMAAEAKRVVIEEFQPTAENTGLEDVAPDVVEMEAPIRPEINMTVNEEHVQLLTEQMRAILETQVPEEAEHATVTDIQSAFMAMVEEEERKKTEETGSSAGAADGGATTADGADAVTSTEQEMETLVVAGTVLYGQLLNELNSDVPGPALIHILSGDIAGSRAIGEYSVEADKYLVLTIDKVVKDGQVLDADAIALDEDTTLAGMASDVDNHYIKRVILPAAAEFIVGMAEAIAETASSTTTGSGGSTVTDEEEPDTEEELAKGGQKAAEKVSEFLDEMGDIDVTVILKRGTPMGILFMESLERPLTSGVQ